MKILGIETSCDETAAAVVEDGATILSNVVASQVEIHARYGGIVPEVASRQHLLSIIPVINQAITEAKVNWGDIQAIAVTMGPGLPGSLLVGVSMAKALSWAHNLPLVGVNHLEAHIYAQWLEPMPPPSFPSLCLIVSGGHTELALMNGHGSYQSLGRTRDDAAGEAFDKASRLLELGYPGGPAIQRAAAQGKARIRLPRALLKDSYDFSFSGLKTALGRHLEKAGGNDQPADVSTTNRFDLAASVQDAVVDVLTAKAIQAARQYNARYILLVGGVAANSRLREWLTQRSPIPVLIPRLSLCTDNAAMVAASGFFQFHSGRRDGWGMDIVSGLRLGVKKWEVRK
ncbi:MAG: tRNA (adenosine(37)-N6)-threonylcarbamoyltransferase complex transferase subunit TsaD [Dehalococcoidia bacterium]|nr:tRNA (adenosine(37)-N6)-threonylcarbamoyltransferase complex transferase subunit TsaD [Dehalococcoidia bacterium]